MERLNNDIIDKVKRECANSLPITERRFNLLKNIEKSQRPWNHEETVIAWQTAIDEYKTQTK